jgi:soluble lytic murein transglycosylase
MVAAATEAKVDPLLIPAIIRQESGFDPSIVSNAGAVGIMQIMPAEASMIATRAGLGAVMTREDLFDPAKNIRIGAAEIAQKLESMHGNLFFGIAAYNAGEEAVGRWLAQSPNEDIDFFVESIPYNETRLYVKNVVRNRFEYQRIYGQPSQASPSP